MKKIIQIIILSGLGILGLAIVGFALYGQYQASQLYPLIHQQIGFQACVGQYQQAQANQSVNQPTDDTQE